MTGQTPDEIHWVRNTQLSIARLYGGITFNGARYVYASTCAVHGSTCDVLIRADVLKLRAQEQKQKAKAARASAKKAQGDLGC